MNTELTVRLRELAVMVAPPFSREEVAAMGKEWNYQKLEIAFPAAEMLATDLLRAALRLEQANDRQP